MSDAEDEVNLLIIHGLPPKARGIIEDGVRRAIETKVRERHDHVTYNRRTSRLAVTGENGAIQLWSMTKN